MNNWLQFWSETLKTVRYYADKHREEGLLNFELTCYSIMCSMLEKYCRLQADQLDKTIDEILNGLKKYDDTGDSDSDTFKIT